jgi:hypothetical protein
MAAEPQFAEGVDGSQLQTELNTLLEQGWALDEDGMGVKKTFYFKTYFKAVVCLFSSLFFFYSSVFSLRRGGIWFFYFLWKARGLSR